MSPKAGYRVRTSPSRYRRKPSQAYHHSPLVLEKGSVQNQSPQATAARRAGTPSAIGGSWPPGRCRPTQFVDCCSPHAQRKSCSRYSTGTVNRCYRWYYSSICRRHSAYRTGRCRICRCPTESRDRPGDAKPNHRKAGYRRENCRPKAQPQNHRR